MATPMDALAFREIYGRTLHGPRGWDQAFTVAPGTPQVPERQVPAMIRSVQQQLTDILDNGEIYYVSSEITELLQDLVLKIDHKKVFHFEPGDFPTRIGLVYFDGPIPIPTILSRSGTQNLRAMLWGQLVSRADDPRSWLVPGSYRDTDDLEVHGKVVYTVCDSIKQFKDRRFERSRTYQERFSGPWSTRHFIPLPYHQRFDAEMTQQHIDNTQWSAGDLTSEEQIQDLADATRSISLALQTLLVWTGFLQTEIVGHHKLDSTQHDKVLAREGRPPAQVRIITLRRYATTAEIKNFVEVNWQYRWKVREHYRNQRVGPGRSFIRRVLVREHWKGPEDKPQAHQDTIQALVR